MQPLAAMSASPVPLFAVLTTSELAQRPSRIAEVAAERRALGSLAQTFAAWPPHSVLQKIADTALDLCRAHSAGVSVLDENRGEPVLRWRAIAGALAPHAGSAWPRAASPCGTVLDRNTVELMSQPVRHFPCIESLSPRIEEALLTPFHLDGAPVGTIWVAAHDRSRRFDAEDARLLTVLGKLAAAACAVPAAFRGLEKGVANDTADLATAANSHKDLFIAILGHELRGRLAPAKAAIELLKGETLDTAKTRWAHEMIERQVDGMTRLVDDLLEVARQQTGALRLRRQTVAIAEIVKRSVETVEPQVTARGHSLVVDVPPEPIFVDADVVWLSQALQNLLANAVKYTNPGGRIGVDARRDGDEVVLTVRDTGIGIEPSALLTVFDPYVQEQSQSHLSGKGLGVGLGLYVARLLIEAHGGTIRAVSAGRDCGTELVVRLPCKPR